MDLTQNSTPRLALKWIFPRAPQLGLLLGLITPLSGWATTTEVHLHQISLGVVLTFDACGGAVDWNLLHFVVEHRLPSTLFLSGKWIKKNPTADTYIKKNADLFHVENHGWSHKEAVMLSPGDYHLPTVRTVQGLTAEVEENSTLIQQVFGVTPHWYRSAGALYDQESLQWLKEHQWKIGGFSIAADMGGKASSHRILSNMQGAKPGDVLLMHMNKPDSQVFSGFQAGYAYWVKNNIPVAALND